MDTSGTGGIKTERHMQPYLGLNLHSPSHSGGIGGVLLPEAATKEVNFDNPNPVIRRATFAPCAPSLSHVAWSKSIVKAAIMGIVSVNLRRGDCTEALCIRRALYTRAGLAGVGIDDAVFQQLLIKLRSRTAQALSYLYGQNIINSPKMVRAALQRAVAHVGSAAQQITSLGRRGTLEDIENKATLLFLEEQWKYAQKAVNPAAAGSSGAKGGVTQKAATLAASVSAKAHLEDPMPVLLATAEMRARYTDDFRMLGLVKEDALVLDYRARAQAKPPSRRFFRDCFAQCPSPLLYVLRPGKQRQPPLMTSAALMNTKIANLFHHDPLDARESFGDDLYLDGYSQGDFGPSTTLLSCITAQAQDPGSDNTDQIYVPYPHLWDMSEHEQQLRRAWHAHEAVHHPHAHTEVLATQYTGTQIGGRSSAAPSRATSPALGDPADKSVAAPHSRAASPALGIATPAVVDVGALVPPPAAEVPRSDPPPLSATRLEWYGMELETAKGCGRRPTHDLSELELEILVDLLRTKSVVSMTPTPNSTQPLKPVMTKMEGARLPSGVWVGNGQGHAPPSSPGGRLPARSGADYSVAGGLASPSSTAAQMSATSFAVPPSLPGMGQGHVALAAGSASPMSAAYSAASLNSVANKIQDKLEVVVVVGVGVGGKP
jgi:hypothetical protein